MDKINKVDKKELTFADVLYDIKDIMLDHNLTADQAMYLLCRYHNIEYDLDLTGVSSLYNKGLLTKGHTVNATLLFHLQRPKQMELDLAFNSKPIGTEITLDRANRIEKTFVLDTYLTDDEKKYIADRYFKGDLIISKYFIIFKSLFPTPHKINNKKWNKKFGFVYTGINLWDSNLRVAKKFIEIYRKFDIGIFLEATYRRVKDSIDFEQEKCFMTKPYKHLLSFTSYYREVEIDLKRKKAHLKKDTENKINKLKI